MTKREEDREHNLEVHIAALVNEVRASKSGNIDLLGIFNTIGATGFPTQIPEMTVLVRVHYSQSESSSAPIETKFRFANEDGVLHEFRFEAWFPPPQTGVWAISDNSITLHNFPIEGAGEYAFEFWMKGHRLCTMPLTVVHVRPDQSFPEGEPRALPSGS
jgi:hypothetical protein